MSEERIGDGPVEEEYEDAMRTIATLIRNILNGDGPEETVGFILMVFPFNDIGHEGRCNYISNANREDIVTLLREQLAYFTGQPVVKPSRA